MNMITLAGQDYRFTHTDIDLGGATIKAELHTLEGRYVAAIVNYRGTGANEVHGGLNGPHAAALAQLQGVLDYAAVAV